MLLVSKVCKVYILQEIPLITEWYYHSEDLSVVSLNKGEILEIHNNSILWVIDKKSTVIWIEFSYGKPSTLIDVTGSNIAIGIQNRLNL